MISDRQETGEKIGDGDRTHCQKRKKRRDTWMGQEGERFGKASPPYKKETGAFLAW